MVVKLVLLMFDALLPSPASPIADDDEMICDDGSSPWDSSNSPNWACTREECTPHDDVCWDDRLDHCYDEQGKNLGVCVFARESCSSRLACFDLWLYCAGEYTCLESGTIGCTKGTCTTDEAGVRSNSLLALESAPYARIGFDG